MSLEKEQMFQNIDADLTPTVVESLCMACGENGVTRILLTVIPHFKEVILMAFECPHCGLKSNEIQSGASIAEKGTKQKCVIKSSRDLSRQVVKSETATIRFEELDFEIPSESQRGILSTVEGIITRAIDGLQQQQPLRRIQHPDLYLQIEDTIQKLKTMTENLMEFTLSINDPAGNSYIENLHAPQSDPQITIEYYSRTAEENEFLGLAQADEPVESNIMNDDLAFKEQVHVFGGNCSRCNAPCETKMHMMDIPHFKDVIIMATTCDSCGYKSNEVKSGGAISSHGKKITLKVTDIEDLSRDILKSETCGLSIPEIDLELTQGTLGGRFTTVEGLLVQVADELKQRSSSFTRGDSATAESKSGFETFLEKLEKILTLEINPFTLIINDPLANSYLQNPYAPDEDPNMKIEEYERSEEQNEEFGLNDIKLENY